METLAGYLNRKHMEYCQRKGRIVPTSDWVINKLNPQLGSDKFSVGTFNHWLNGSRDPDEKNMKRLITVFGPEVMPALGIQLEGDLAKVVGRWDKTPKDAKKAILDISENPELATLQL